MQPLEELRGGRKQHAEEHGSCDRNKQRCREVEGIEHYEDGNNGHRPSTGGQRREFIALALRIKRRFSLLQRSALGWHGYLDRQCAPDK